jgi:hypothetical protein
LAFFVVPTVKRGKYSADFRRKWAEIRRSDLGLPRYKGVGQGNRKFGVGELEKESYGNKKALERVGSSADLLER